MSEYQIMEKLNRTCHTCGKVQKHRWEFIIRVVHGDAFGIAVKHAGMNIKGEMNKEDEGGLENHAKI